MVRAMFTPKRILIYVNLRKIKTVAKYTAATAKNTHFNSHAGVEY